MLKHKKDEALKKKFDIVEYIAIKNFDSSKSLARAENGKFQTEKPFVICPSDQELRLRMREDLLWIRRERWTTQQRMISKWPPGIRKDGELSYTSGKS